MPKRSSPSPFSALALAGEIGYLIAIPAVLFGFGGAYLDKYMHTTPLWMLLGFVLALLSSGFAVWRLVQRLSPPEAHTTVKEKPKTPDQPKQEPLPSKSSLS